MPQGSQAEEPSAPENCPRRIFRMLLPGSALRFPGSHSLHTMEPDAGATSLTLQASRLDPTGPEAPGLATVAFGLAAGARPSLGAR